MTASRLAHRGRLAPGASEVGEMVHVVGGVLVLGEDGKAVREILEPVLGDEVGAWVERVPARAIERHRPLESSGGLIEELGSGRRAKREALEIVEQALGL